MQTVLRNQRGFTGLAIVALLLVLIVGAVGFFVTNYFSYANTGARLENALQAKQDENKVIMGNFSTSIKEIAQTARMSVDAQTKLIEMANQSRYGQDGSKATMQFFQEQNPTADVTIYNRLAQTIQSERTRFEESQKEMRDQSRAYKTLVDQPYSGFWLRLAGYPKINFKDFDVVTNDYTDQAFKTKHAEAIDLSK